MIDIANGVVIVVSIGGLVLWFYGSLANQHWARLWGSASIALADVAAFAADVAAGDGWAALLSVVFAVIWGLIWWSERKRKRRDPAAKTLGAKSRLLVAAIVERARESAKPKPVLRPVPGGAGA